MARFAVTSTSAADAELADILLNSPPDLRREITAACNRMDSMLPFADLLPNYRQRQSVARLFSVLVFPLRAYYEIDNQTLTVTVTHYRLELRPFRP